MRSLQIGNSVRQSKLNSGGFATEEELHFSGKDRGTGGDGKADGNPRGRRVLLRWCSSLRRGDLEAADSSQVTMQIEVIEVGAGELLRLGGEGLVLLPDTRRRRRWVSERELVGSGQASFLSIFVAGLLEY